MTLDPNKLEEAEIAGDMLIARCPACAEHGRDKAGRNLHVRDKGLGAFWCSEDSEGRGGFHNKRIYALASVGPTPTAVQFQRFLRHEVRERPICRAIPDFHEPPADLVVKIATRCGWGHARGLRYLVARGMLYIADIYDDGGFDAAWIVTDRSQINAQALRVDGKRWQSDNAVAKTLPGYNSHWPIGAANIGDLPIVILCQDARDLAASLSVAQIERLPHYEIAPVCMPEVELAIPDDVLPLFAKKRVRIFARPDEAGKDAFKRWAHQLIGVGAMVDGHVFEGIETHDGDAVEGLSDYLTLLDPDKPILSEVLTDLFPPIDTNAFS